MKVASVDNYFEYFHFEGRRRSGIEGCESRKSFLLCLLNC